MNFDEFTKIMIDGGLIKLFHRKNVTIYQTNPWYCEGSERWESFWAQELEARKFLEETFKTWDRYIMCLKTGYCEPPECPICGEPVKVNLSHGKWCSTCGKPECVKAYLNLEETKNKRYDTNYELYGDRFPMRLTEFQEKQQATCLERYGTTNPMSLDEFKEKKAKTCLEKYGHVCSLQGEEVKVKAENTMQKRYGNKVYFRTKDFIQKRARPYRYKEMNFDSSWELAFYIYNEDNGVILEREPVSFHYYDEIDDVDREYWPDFYNKELDKFYEIKSDYTTENTPQGKLDLIKELNAEFIDNEGINFYLNYIKEKYGKDYLMSFKEY